MPKIIKQEMPDAIFVVFPWGAPPDDSSIKSKVGSALDDPAMIWVYMVTYSGDPDLEEDTIYSNFHLIEEGKATQKDFDEFLEKHIRIGLNFVGSGVDDTVEEYFDSIYDSDGENDDFDFNKVPVRAPFVKPPDTKLWNNHSEHPEARNFAPKLVTGDNLECLKIRQIGRAHV